VQLEFVKPVVEPNWPAGQSAVQVAVGSNIVEPYVPTGQFVHDAAPNTLYVPTGHAAAVEFLDPAGQLYPAEQFPLQAAVVIPVADPYLPARHCPLQVGVESPLVSPYVPTGHGAVHAAVDSPDVLPNNPAGQLAHTAAPVRLNVPIAQMDALPTVEPEGQLYPGRKVQVRE
jgi:hypothetical protein